MEIDSKDVVQTHMKVEENEDEMRLDPGELLSSGTALSAGEQIIGAKRKRGHSQPIKPEPLMTPSDVIGAPSPTPESVVLSKENVTADKPRLTISRHPIFVPIAGTGDPPLCTTELVLMNRALSSTGFRYYPAGLAEPGDAVPYRTIESNPTSVRVSWEDRSSCIRVTEDGLGLGGEGGFRSARCNVPVREGKWYMEVRIEKGGGEPGQKGVQDGAHVRLGWGRREAPLNAPIGLDGYSYGFRDKTGEKVTVSRPKPYGKPFKTGDIIGLYISLPPKRQPDPNDPNDPAHMQRRRIAIESKGQEYWESLEIQPTKEMIALMAAKVRKPVGEETESPSSSPSKKSAAVKNPTSTPRRKAKPQDPVLRPLPTLGSDSLIAFFVNGESQGVAFRDLYDYLQLKELPKKEKPKKKDTFVRQHEENPFDDGTLGYYPLLSLYNDARIRLNPGPDFDFPPPNDIDATLAGEDVFGTMDTDTKHKTWRPLCERYSEYMKEMWQQDDVDEEEAKAQLVIQARIDAEEDEKRIIKEKKRQDALARKKVKQASSNAEEPSKSLLSPSPDDRFGPDVNEFLQSAVDAAGGGVDNSSDSLLASREGSADISGPSSVFDGEMPEPSEETPASTPHPYEEEEAEEEGEEDADGEIDDGTDRLLEELLP